MGNELPADRGGVIGVPFSIVGGGGGGGGRGDLLKLGDVIAGRIDDFGNRSLLHPT